MTERIFVLKGRLMTHQADSTTLDLFRERLASPFIFTFFWVSCTWNWKIIYWFLYEPLKPSIKLQQIPFEWCYFFPLILTLLIVALVPWVNNAVEVLKRYAGNCFNSWLHQKGWKEMVSNDEHVVILDQASILKRTIHDLTDSLENKQAELIKSKEDAVNKQEEILTLLGEIDSLKEKEIFFKSERVELKNKLNEADQLLIEQNQKNVNLRQKLEVEIEDLLSLFGNNSLNNIGTMKVQEVLHAKDKIEQLRRKLS